MSLDYLDVAGSTPTARAILKIELTYTIVRLGKTDLKKTVFALGCWVESEKGVQEKLRFPQHKTLTLMEKRTFVMNTLNRKAKIIISLPNLTEYFQFPKFLAGKRKGDYVTFTYSMGFTFISNSKLNFNVRWTHPNKLDYI